MDRLTVLFATTTVALGATSVWFAQQLASQRERADLLAERVAAFESARDRASGRSTPAVGSTPAVDPESSDPSAEHEVSKTAPQRRDTDEWIARFREDEARLLRSPSYREHWLTIKTLSLREAYDGLQALLGLSDAEYEDFLAKMAQFEFEQTLRNFEAPLQRGLDPAGRIVAGRQQTADTETARRQVLRDTLGEAQYRQWTDYQRTVAGRRELERWRIELATAGLSLTPDQSQDLLPILVEHQQRIAALPPTAVFLGRAHATPTGASNALLELERRSASQADINAWLSDALTGVLTAEQRELITATSNRVVELQRAQLELDRVRLAEQGKP